jgi:hypothetical protein
MLDNILVSKAFSVIHVKEQNQANHLKQKKEFIQGNYHMDLPNIVEMITTKHG